MPPFPKRKLCKDGARCKHGPADPALTLRSHENEPVCSRRGTEIPDQEKGKCHGQSMRFPLASGPGVGAASGAEWSRKKKKKELLRIWTQTQVRSKLTIMGHYSPVSRLSFFQL